MIKDIKEKNNEKIEIDLTGPDGNAFYLLGMAKKLSKKLDLDTDKITLEMMSKDYNNLITVFDKYFGEFVTLYK